MKSLNEHLNEGINLSKIENELLDSFDGSESYEEFLIVLGSVLGKKFNNSDLEKLKKWYDTKF